MPPLLTALVSLSLVLQLCVSGCAVGPSYRKPATMLEDFHGVGALATRRARVPAPPLEAWWDGFNDPMLSSLVQRARDQNLDLAAALARVQQGRAAAREAGAQLLPTFDVNGQATRIHYSLAGVHSAHHLSVLGIDGVHADRRTAAGTVLTLLFLPALYAIWFRVKKPGNTPALQSFVYMGEEHVPG